MYNIARYHRNRAMKCLSGVVTPSPIVLVQLHTLLLPVTFETATANLLLCTLKMVHSYAYLVDECAMHTGRLCALMCSLYPRCDFAPSQLCIETCLA